MSAAPERWRELVAAELVRKGWTGNGELKGRCLDAGHEDGNPSATWSTASGCGQCLGCGATWSTREAADLLGVELPGEAPAGTPAGIFGTWKGAGFSALWTYRDAGGRELGHVVRYDGDGGKVVIPWFQRNGSGWKSGAAAKPRPLYGLDRLAARPDAPVVITEGEKAADAAGKLLPDHVSVTWAGGSKAVATADWKPLAGRIVAVWPDRDAPGAAAGREVVAKLAALGCEVAMVDVEALGLPESGDAADLAELPDGELPLIGAELETATPLPESSAAGLRFTRATDFAAEVPEDREWLAPPYFPKGGMVLLDGKPKTAGKTSLLLALSRSTTTGEAFLGEKAAKGPVVYLSEQGRSLLRPYLDAAGLLSVPDFYFLTWGDAFGKSWQEIATAAAEECRRVNAAMLVVDTVGRWMGLRDDKSNSEGAVREALAPLKAAAESGLCVVLARHEGKADRAVGEAGLGSTAFQGEVDGILSLRRPDGGASDNARMLHFQGRWEAPERQVVERDYRDHGIYRTCSGVASLDVRVLQQVRCAPGSTKTAACKGISGRKADVLATIERLLRTDPPMLVDRGRGDHSALFVAEMAGAR